jgi:hypothetical protein
MELSPLAREKLARIGELTPEEKARLRCSNELNLLLAEYFTNELGPDDLWRKLKEHRDAGQEFILRDAQSRMLDAISLSSNDADLDKLRRGILAAESLKYDGDYTTLERDLDDIISLRRQYREERGRAYEAIRATVERKVRAAAHQIAVEAAVKGETIDVQGSVEATTKASPEWKSFISRHEDTYNQKLKERLTSLRKRLKIQG